MPCSRRLIVQTLVFSRSYLHRQLSSPETLVVKGGTTWARNGRWILPENARLPRNIQGSFTCRKFSTWDKRFYFPSEGRHAEDISPWKIRRLRLEPANLGTKGQHATSRPPKPLCTELCIINNRVAVVPISRLSLFLCQPNIISAPETNDSRKAAISSHAVTIGVRYFVTKLHATLIYSLTKPNKITLLMRFVEQLFGIP